MFGLSLGEMVLLGTIALIAIDPKDLPRVARTIGKFINEMKRASGDITKNFSDVTDVARSQFHDVRKEMDDVFTGITAPSPAAPLTPDPQMALSPVELTPDPIVEEQLAFQLTNFDEETRNDV